MNLNVLFISFHFRVVCLFQRGGTAGFLARQLCNRHTCTWLSVLQSLINTVYSAVFICRFVLTGWYYSTVHHSAVSSLLLCLYLITMPMDRCSLRSGLILILAAEEMSGPEKPRTMQLYCATCLPLVSLWKSPNIILSYSSQKISAQEVVEVAKICADEYFCFVMLTE